MPGSWELANNTSVLCAILNTEITTVAWALHFKNLQIPGNTISLQGMPFDHARNQAAEACLQGGYEWLFFLDSDVGVMAGDGLMRLLSHRLPIISGVYHRRSDPHGIPVMMKPVGQWLMDYPKNALIEVDTVGAGCLLIHRSVFEKLPPQRPGKHWFDWRVDLKQHIPLLEAMSEDFTFCSHAKKHGYKIMVDTGVQCKHIGFSEVIHNKMIPLGGNPNL